VTVNATVAKFSVGKIHPFPISGKTVYSERAMVDRYKREDAALAKEDGE
jgi:hypothetical protein